MQRAVTYSRYSSDQQNPRSATDQTRLCRTHAEAHGWRGVESYEDLAVSGASRFRPAFQRLVADARARRFDIVVCEALDRLARKLADIAELFDQLSFLGLQIHTVQQGPITAMHIGLLGTMSQLCLSDLKAKTHRGLRAVAEHGRSAGGLCYGYRVVSGIAGKPGRTEPRGHSGAARRHLAGRHNPQPGRPGHRHPAQPPLCRPAGLEPAAGG
jgi:DNA invertase Pin-like site-specific DNA recombinase